MKLAATLIAALVVPVACTGAFAGDYKVGTLEIGNPWSRATPGGTTIGAGYMTIRNTGTASDRLIGGTTDVANDFQFHQTTIEGDVSKMHEMKSGVEIKPGETVEFKPGSTHVMFVKLKHPLRQHDVIKGTLVFEKAGTIEIEYTVGGIGAQTGDQHTQFTSSGTGFSALIGCRMLNKRNTTQSLGSGALWISFSTLCVPKT